jgi:hypothetical protein
MIGASLTRRLLGARDPGAVFSRSRAAARLTAPISRPPLLRVANRCSLK